MSFRWRKGCSNQEAWSWGEGTEHLSARDDRCQDTHYEDSKYVKSALALAKHTPVPVNYGAVEDPSFQLLRGLASMGPSMTVWLGSWLDCGEYNVERAADTDI